MWRMWTTETHTATTTTTSTPTPTSTTTPLTQEIERMQTEHNYQKKLTAPATLRRANNAGSSHGKTRLQHGQSLYYFRRTATSLHAT